MALITIAFMNKTTEEATNKPKCTSSLPVGKIESPQEVDPVTLTRKAPRQVKAVRFSRKVEIVARLPRVDKLNKEEVASRWYSISELRKHRHRDQRIVKAFITAASTANNGQDLENQVRVQANCSDSYDSTCSSKEESWEETGLLPNGLHTPEQKERKRKGVRVAILSVLLEQEQQWDQGENFPDPALLARVYGAMTKTSIDRARRTGELVAASLYDNPKQDAGREW